MRIVLFGPPGAGKGTQARLLCERFHLEHISTGDIIRGVIKSTSALGEEARKYVNQGKLLPGVLVRQLAESAIERAGFQRFVLDGYPRTVEQAEWLTHFLGGRGLDVDAVINIRVPVEDIVQRLSRRRINRITGESYHLDFNPPPPSIDPLDIVQRPDDEPAAIRKRLEVYAEETQAVLDYYQPTGLLNHIDGTGSVEDVSGRILAIVDQAVRM